MKRGRPTQIDPNLLQSVLIQFKQRIFSEENGKVLSKSDPVWSEISIHLFEVCGIQKTASALHTHVTCRKIFSKDQTNTTIDNVI